MVLESTGYIVQDLFARGFHKLVPLAKDSNTPNVNSGGVIAVADDPKFWTPLKLADNYYKFYNIATTFGPQLLADGSIGYNHCLDVDSGTVREALETYLPELKRLTYIVQTKKGLHIHWIEHTQHEHIGNVSSGRRVKRCMPGYEFEIKTDHKGGLAHLPPSFHRDDIKEKVPNPFRYHKLEGCADKVGVIDNFFGSGLGLYDFLLQPQILGQHIREPNDRKKGAIVQLLPGTIPGSIHEKKKKKDTQENNGTPCSSTTVDNEEPEEEEDEQNEILLDDDEYHEKPPQLVQPSNLHFICADRIYDLVDKWYVKDHRNNAMLCITGAIRRSWSDIAFEDAENIITEFCKIAEDEELSARLATLRSTYEKEDVGEVAGFGAFNDVISKLQSEMPTDQQTQTIKDIRAGIYAALDDFKANSILARYPNLEIDKSSHRHLVIFDHTIEEVFFPQEYNSILKETLRSVKRKSLLLNAAPVPPIQEIWDPIYNQTKYSKMSFRSLGKAGKTVVKHLDRPLVIDELEEWLRTNASYYHKPGRLSEAIHAIVDAYTKSGLVKHKVGTEIEGLVFLSDKKEEGQPKLVLSNMDRPPMPTKEQAQACVRVIQDAHTRFYSGSELEVCRHAHFLKVGAVAPIDFARRQSGAVNQYDGFIRRQDLGGWTDSGKTLGYAAIPLRMYRLPLIKGVNVSGHTRFYVIGSGSVDSTARFIEQTRWTTMPVIFDEADRFSEWQEDKIARQILSLIKNSTQITNPRDTLTSDSEQNIRPSCAFVMLTHNSPLIQEDGFNKRCDGHEFTINDEKSKYKMKEFNEFWDVNGHNITAFGYLGDFNINYYLDHLGVLDKKPLDIAETLLHAFWNHAGFSDEEFHNEWNRWLSKMVESATSKEGLIKARTANIVSMLRQMINDGWVRNRQQLVIWIAKHKREGVYAAKELDNETGKLNETLDEISAEATFKEKLEALLETNSLTYLVLHPKLGVTMDSSVIDEMKNRYRISRVTHQGLADLLGFEYGPARFGNEVKKVVYAPLERFADRIAPSRGEEMAEE